MDTNYTFILIVIKYDDVSGWAWILHYIKSRAIILTRVQNQAYTEPSSFSSLFNLPYRKDMHYFSQARHIAHPTTQCRKFFKYYFKL